MLDNPYCLQSRWVPMELTIHVQAEHERLIREALG